MVGTIRLAWIARLDMLSEHLYGGSFILEEEATL